ncbi:hypothetical protein J6590_078803 [Homalodisca vitripennis]|nr:hypothetical protein J6590_078803 [Homalodisca vitripennis]
MPNAAQSLRSYNFEELHLINFRTSTTDKRQYAVAANTRGTSRCCQCVLVACLTPHGLHLTTTGKSFLAGLIVKELTSLPRRRFRTPAPTAPPRSPSAPPTPPSPPTPTAQHHSYAEAVISRPAGQYTDLNPK